MKFQGERVVADVLVIGGGGAGSRAALEASAHGSRVVLINKMGYGVSGATAFKAAVIGQYQAVGRDRSEGDSLEVHASDIVQAGAGMADEKLVRILVEEAPRRIADLENWGVRFERQGERYHIIKGCFASIPRSHVLKDHGFPIARALERAVRADARIRVLEHNLVTDLLMDGGRCAGALAVNRQGRWTAIHARSVVIAAGGASRIYRSSMYPNDITGDSYALAYQAGAWLTNMEFVQLGLVLVRPRGGAVNTWTWRMRPRLVNGSGDEFLADYLPEGVSVEEAQALKANHWPFTTSDASSAIEISVQDQILRGHAAANGGIRVDFTHVGRREFDALPDTFKPVWTMMADNFLKRGIDLSREPLEAVVGSHSVNGGLYIRDTGATTVPGLYACGECAAGMHGADRLGGNNLPSSQVFGRRAGLHAAEYASGSPASAVDEALIGGLIGDWRRRCAGGGGAPSVGALKERLREAVSKALCTNRTEAGLAELLQATEEIGGQFEAVHESRKGPFESAELRHMLISARLIAAAARERRETRGPHHRKDYPQRSAGQETSIFLRRPERGGASALPLVRRHAINHLDERMLLP